MTLLERIEKKARSFPFIHTYGSSDVLALVELANAVEWVLHDADFKAPEQVGAVGWRWIDRLRDAQRALMEEE